MEQDEIDNKFIREYPFLNYILEDKSHYKRARDAGYNDPNNLFMIGDSGGFLMDININDKFVDTHKLTEMADFHRTNNKYTFLRKIVFLIDNSVREKNIEENMVLMLLVCFVMVN